MQVALLKGPSRVEPPGGGGRVGLYAGYSLICDLGGLLTCVNSTSRSVGRLAGENLGRIRRSPASKVPAVLAR